MEKLPHEIRSEIFCHLELKQKLNCLCICKSWNKWLTPLVYRKILIRRPRMLTMHLTNNPDVANFVDGLTIAMRCAKEDVFDLLKFTIHLSELSVKCLRLTMNDLITLHKLLPNLKSLKLIDLEFSATEEEEAADLISAPVHLDELDIQYDPYSKHFFDREGVLPLLSYVSKVYSGLSSFSFVLADNDAQLSVTDAAERNLMRLLAQCPQLKHYNHMFCPITPSIVQTMDAVGIQLETATLHINNQTAVSQVHALTDSKQIQSIKSLSLFTFDALHTLDPYANSIETQIFQNFTRFSNLTHLSFGNHRGYMFCLTTLINCLNHMHHLLDVSLFDVRLISNQIPDITTVYQLKRLQINILWIPSSRYLEPVNGVFHVLFQKCPHLQKLVLKTQMFFEFSDELPETQPTLILNFEAQRELKLVEITMGYGIHEHYKIRDSLGNFNYYFLDTSYRQITQKDTLPPHKYYTTILLTHPTEISFSSFSKDMTYPIERSVLCLF